MAVPETERDVFRRHVQQTFADHYSVHNDTNFNVNNSNSEEKPKQSPYCIQNFLWLGVAATVFYFSDFLNVILFDQRIKSSWFWCGFLSFGVHVGIALFLVFWQSIWKKVSSDELERRYPKAYPVATAAFLIGILCMSMSLWPVWGFLTPVILLILFMGGIVIIAMLG
ncbi:unnamed protein product [Lymnaea stagnalis]|uniref:Transmembrane protein n=1 Tax=Lymnaea stagnalis TaxID=6523 RepID=A0AAV2GY55_LYMST